MSDQTSQPKIPVKKSDGSTVFMTMAEFQAYKNQGTPSAPPIQVPTPAPGSNVSEPISNDQASTNGQVSSDRVSEGKSKRKRKRKKKNKAVSAPLENTQDKSTTSSVSELHPEEEIMGMSVGKKLEPGKVEVIGETDLPAVSSSVQMSNTAPVKDIFVDEAMAEKAMPSEPTPEPEPESQPEPQSESEPEQEQEPAPTPPQTDPSPMEASIMDATALEEPPTEEPPKTSWKPEDHASLLEETVEKDTLPTPSIPASDDHAELVKKIQSEFPFPVAKDLQGRFESLVASQLKGIREPHDIEATALKSTQEGGLGMNEDQAKMLLAVIAAAQKLASPHEPKMPQPPKPAILSDANSIPTVTSNSAPTPSTPSAPAPGPAIQKINFEELSPVGPKSSETSASESKIPLPKEEYQFTLPTNSNGTSAPKPAMKDVVTAPSAKRTMGPVDELHIFSLVDFRRLSPKPDAAKEIMKEKFQALQQESYVLFLDARDAWHESPLFVQYQTVLLSTLESGQPLAEKIASDSNGLTEDEFWAIVDINHFLG